MFQRVSRTSRRLNNLGDFVQVCSGLGDCQQRSGLRFLTEALYSLAQGFNNCNYGALRDLVAPYLSSAAPLRKENNSQQKP